jgi:predicted N-formylglutamate amidohydrolase
LLNVMIEIRNDLISDNSEQKAMARRIATALTSALGALHDAAAGAQHQRLRRG